MTHQDYKEMIPAHALSALDATDDRLLTVHLADCAECRRELEDWGQTTSSLAFAAEPLEPSNQLRDRILTQVRNESKEVPKSNVIPIARNPRNAWSSFGSLGAIAAALLFVALLLYVVLLWKENRAITNEAKQLRAEIEKTQKNLDTQAKLIQMFAKPGTQFAELTGMPTAPNASAKLAYDKTGHAMVMTSGLPTPPAGKEYQLWFIVGGKPMPGKTFSTDPQGKAMMEDQIPAVAMNSPVFAVTLEPKNGVPSPTGDMYLRSGS